MQLNNGNWIKTGEAYGYVFDWDRQFQYATCDGQPTDFIPDGTRVNENDILCSISDAVTALKSRENKKAGKEQRKTTGIGGVYLPWSCWLPRQAVCSDFGRSAKEYSLDRHLRKPREKFQFLINNLKDPVQDMPSQQLRIIFYKPDKLCRMQLKWVRICCIHLQRNTMSGPDLTIVAAAQEERSKPGTSMECAASQPGHLQKDERLDRAIAHDALTRPLGAYFRVNHKDLVAMHSAITEAGILFVTLDTHEGWDNVKSDGIVKFDADKFISGGGHAVALVGYDQKDSGFRIHGQKLGKKGYGHICYDDWLSNGWDVWVARLGAPVEQSESSMISREYSSAHSAKKRNFHSGIKTHTSSQLRTTVFWVHVEVTVRPPDDLDVMFGETFDSITKSWKKKEFCFMHMVDWWTRNPRYND